MDNQTEYAELEFIDEPIYIHPKEIFVSKIIDDIEIENKSNTFFDDRKDMIILDKNTDVYTDTGKLLLKFRTNVIPDEYVNILYNNMKSAAPKSGGRSESSGKPEDGNIYKTAPTLAHEYQLRINQIEQELLKKIATWEELEKK